MGLMQKAVETYDAMEHLVGVIEEGKEPLAPVGHISTKAAIEITIDRDGRFVQAKRTDQKIIIPTTEKSSGRTSAPEAHPLCDQIGYISGCDDSNNKKALYINQLQKWCAFDHNPKLEAVLKYVEQGSVIEDLKRSDLIVYDSNGRVKNDKDLVCWRVAGIGEDDSAVWNDKHIHESFQKFYDSQTANEEKEISYISGCRDVPANQHMKGVLSMAGNAKLISSNDTTNFTFRGRFSVAGEALTIGYTDSQKAHNALKWIIANQGTTIGGRSFVCWNPRGNKLPKPLLPLFDKDDRKATPTEYKDNLYKYIMGFENNMHADDKAITASFDAATSGRLAVTYYNELQGSDFLHRLRLWDEWCCWYDNRWGTEAPALKSIVRYAFGVQRGDGESAKVEADDRIMGQTLQRLLASRMEMSPFPTDIMRALVHKTYMAESYNSKNRRYLQFVTCAAVRKYRHDRFKEEWDMALEPKNKDRSYQFGRLLAILEKAEKDTYGEGEMRETNAIRMQSVFVQRPAYAAKIILDKIKTAYYPQLKIGQRNYYEKLIGQIMQIISESGEDEYNKPLKETYILGYYLQKNELYTKKEKNEEEE